MGSIINAEATWTPDVVVPVPGEPIRAGGGIQSPMDITGNAGDKNGTVTYTGLVPYVRIRHVNAGNSQTLLATVTGNDISVKLATSNVGVVTSTANQVVAEVLAKAAGLVDAVVRGNGNGLAGVKDWVQISAGTLGSIYPMEQAFANNDLFFKNRTDDMLSYHTSVTLHDRIRLVTASTAEIKRYAVPSYYGFLLDGGLPAKGFFSGLSETTPGNHLSAANLEPAGAFANNTWYYIYLDGTSGVGIDKIKTTTPNDFKTVMTGSSYYRYIGCFRTDGTAQIKTFRKIGNRTVYLQRIEEYNNVSLSSDVNSPSTFTLAWCPPGCVYVRLRLVITNSNNAAKLFYWSQSSPLISYYSYTVPANGSAMTEIVVSSEQLTPTINFAAYGGDANMSLSVQMLEFVE